ncbi:HAD hydrolase-like protein [Maritimibacter sp. DP1N21-5]|uniref:HAD hydrolase-like protein n=1 Tax=Maritimibacter sp. DP1N21-5 TaxID=2836867 RepID=UPI001C46C4A9|nr:HAD hydrolase-like protein [Maritimibacter sp. DP1N21-5]MBV7407757.1 HAD hydrolase-like protein [Maritimibacter sp. DP1N21-5]
MSTVFLDLDGTLTDPKPGITRSVIHALQRLGLPAPEEDELTWVIGPALIDSFARLGVSEPDIALAHYRERFSTVGLFENAPFDGIHDVLDRLAASHRLCLATAKPHDFAVRITEKFGLDRHLAAQFGPELDGTRNDKAELLAYALDTLGADPADCVMVGDRHHDFDAARANGMASVAVTWGYGTDEEYRGATVICRTLAYLPQAVDVALGMD